MEPENPSAPEEQHPAEATPESGLPPQPPALNPDVQEFAWLIRIFIGPQGLRAGWSVFLFSLLSVIFFIPSSMIVIALTDLGQSSGSVVFSPKTAFVSQLAQVLAILAAGILMARFERRRLRDYYLKGQRRFAHFSGGLVVGFTAISALVGALAWGHWLRFGPVALSGGRIVEFGAAWAAVFLLTSFFEEGSFRCYFQFTFTRGINFWWALGTVSIVCLIPALPNIGTEAWGVDIVALLGLFPCLVMHFKRIPGSGFWQATWVTCTLFGCFHLGNSGETWIGIFATAAIGFVFCVSIWVTGSAWWAIGCHAAWDWAETFFFGTADSGLQPKGHLLTTSPAGNTLWSGGTTGPEGSVLILGSLVLLLAALLLIYGRKCALPDPSRAAEQLTT